MQFIYRTSTFIMRATCSWILLLAGNFLLADAANSTQQLDPVYLRFYNRNNTFTDAYRGQVTGVVSQFDRDAETVVYIHGYEETSESPSVQLIAHAYLSYTNANVLALDYRDAATLVYPEAARLVSDVGGQAGSILNEMVAAGADPRRFHIVGHSLGSHVAGAVGRSTSFRIPRITGLDPAGPLFYILKPRLSTSDAEFVDVVHTDSGFYGLGLLVGHANFLPNFGHRPQPGCPFAGPLLSEKDLCSHHRSYEFYAESIRHPDAFLAVECRSSLDFVLGSCNSRRTVPMGYSTPTDTRGSYYLLTNAEAPFGRGRQGTRFGAPGWINLSRD